MNLKKFLNIRFLYRKLKFRYKLSIYFTLFGLLIGYISYIMFTGITTMRFIHMGKSFIEKWRVESNLPGDFLLSSIDKQFSATLNILFPAIDILTNGIYSGSPEVNEEYIFYYNRAEKQWYRLYRNRYDIMKSIAIQENAETEEIKKVMDSSVYNSRSPFYGRSDKFSLLINLTRPCDANLYFLKIISGRSGILDFLGGGLIIFIYAAVLLMFSIFMARLISLHISRPISRLSRQAAAIAGGDLDLRSEIHSKDEIGELSSALNFMAETISNNLYDIKNRMEAISVMNRIDKAVLSSISRRELIDSVTSIVSELFKESHVSLAMSEPDNARYHLLSHYMMGRRKMPDDEYYISFDRLSPSILERNTGFYILSIESDREIIEWLNGIVHQDYMHIMNLPIYMDEEYTGSLIVGKVTDVPFTDFEKDTLKALADQTGVAMKSVKYVEERENLYLGILLALARTIDAKSKWTAGHSERVAAYSEKISEALGMNQNFIENIKVSASLHDIGKIGVPEVILDKEGALTEDEFSVIKKHPQGGAEIIESIPGYEKFLNGIIFHYEYWNGCGYPFGLEKERIPVMGRIIAVADVYDSLVSDRPYRKGMSREKAFEILTSEKGRKLDPAIVDIMIEIIKKSEF